MRAKDWAATPLGPTDAWPESLRTSVSTCLNCSFPILIWWGPELVKIYNDAYAEIIAAKHPHALGSPGREVWPEIWDTIGPMLDRVTGAGEAFPANDLRLDLHRKGYLEECYFSFSYSPIRDETGRVAGVFCPVVETTDRVFAERRSALLLELEDRLREAADPISVKATVSAMIGPHFGVGQAVYAEVQPDDEFVLIEAAWNDDKVPRLAGLYRLPELGSTLIAELQRDRVVSIDDVQSDPRTSAPQSLRNFANIQIRSFLAVPLFKNNRFIAYLSLSDSKPRQWNSHEASVLRDFTERAWAALERTRASIQLLESETRLRVLNEELEARVETRTQELMVAEDALRQAQKMEAVGQLTGGIAHDFNNLLAGISGSLELLEKRLAEGRLTGLDRYISTAQASARRAASLTQRLLAFARRQTLDPRALDADRMIAGMADLLQRTVGPAVRIEVVQTVRLWATKVDPSQLENALLNLCINARDAMAPDGGTITIETANKWLDDRAAKERELPPGQYVSICVSDTGAGMTPEVIAKAFDPFFTTKPLGQGTGLGLSMIYGFVRQSGGQVRVYSEIGKGTTMCLYLPRHIGDVAEEPEIADPQADLGAGETVLIIDDEPAVRMLVAETLADRGYRVIEAEDGVSGLKMLQSAARIDLLITDVGLPGGLNGRQVADAARETRPELKVLFITGFAENAAVGAGRLAVGMSVVTKPFAMAALANKVRELIDGKRI